MLVERLNVCLQLTALLRRGLNLWTIGIQLLPAEWESVRQ